MAQETVPERPAVPETPEQTRPAPGRTGRVLGWTRRGSDAGWPRTLAAVASGLVMWLAFPPYDLWPLAPLGVAAFTLLLRGLRPRTAGWLGLVTGAAFFLPVLTGLIPIGPDAWLALGLVQALYFIPMAAGMAVAARLPGWPVWIAALWVAQELVRGRFPFGGFPWARLAFSQTDTPLTPYAAVGGAPLVTFLTALAGTLLAYAALRAYERPGRWSGSGPVAVAVAVIAAMPLLGFTVPVPASGRPVTAAVIQGNVPRMGLDFNSQRQAVLDNHVRATHELAARVRAGRVPRPQLVIWPENSSDLDPYTDGGARDLIDGAVRDVGVPVLVGAVVDAADPDHVENRGIVWDPASGPGAYYVKRHPVPFGEYLPFRDVLTRLITRFERIPRDFTRGGPAGRLRVGPARIGDVICFEVAYDGVVRDVADQELLVVQTNNATFGRTSLPHQQLAMSRLRAVEHGRSVLVAATSGISAIIAPDGRMIDKSAEFTRDIQVATVPARTATTLADRVGAVPEWLLALAAAAAVALGAPAVRDRAGRLPGLRRLRSGRSGE